VKHNFREIIVRPFRKESIAYIPIVKSDLALVLPPMKTYIRSYEEVSALSISHVNWLIPLTKLLKEH